MLLNDLKMKDNDILEKKISALTENIESNREMWIKA